MAGNFEYYGIPPTQKGLEYRLEQTAAGGETVFVIPYTVGMVDVYINGILQPNAAYSAVNTTSVTLVTPLTAGQIIKIASRSTAQVGVVTSYTQAQADAGFATITNLNTKADISKIPKRGYYLFIGNM
jgi:hypothetical protein